MVKFTLSYRRLVHRGASSRGVVKVGRDAAPASVAKRKATSPGGGGEPSRGAKTAGRSDRSVEGVKPELPRGAPNGETHRYKCVGPAGQGSPRSDPGGSASNPDHASLRRAIPLVGGKENRRDYGRTPAPAQEQGPYRFATSEGFIAGPACAPPRRPQFEWGADCCYWSRTWHACSNSRSTAGRAPTQCPTTCCSWIICGKSSA